MEPKSNQTETIMAKTVANSMASITIKNIPEPLYLALKNSAATHHRSINGEVIFRLEEALLPRRVSRDELLDQIRRVREEIGKGAALSPEEIEAAINEGRE